MTKVELVRHVKAESKKLKQTIVKAIAENDPQSQVTVEAVNHELNKTVEQAVV